MKKNLNKYFLLVLIAFFFCSPVYAINWLKLVTPLNRVVYLDIDSICEKDNYYFYNVKFNSSSETIIATVQSSKNTPFSKTLKTYSEAQYQQLNGDYENIYANMTDALEPVLYESTINTCYKKVKSIMLLKTNSITY